MKKLILLILVLVIASCSNTLQITKRHYLKGYYVSHTKHHKEKQTLADAPKKKTPVQPEQVYVPQNTKNLGEPLLEKKELLHKAPVLTASKVNLLAKARATKKSLHAQLLPNHAAPVFSPKPLVVTQANSSNEGRSLFWIVVLVLLILWALGIISGSFGIGILFNLLLVIALILLILWLLRLV